MKGWLTSTKMSLSILVRTLSLTGETNRTYLEKNQQKSQLFFFCCDTTNTALPFKEAFFSTFIAYNCPPSGPTIFRTRNTWKPKRKHSKREADVSSDRSTLDYFPYLAKRALTEDFKKLKLRRIRFLTALFHMMGDGNLFIRAVFLRERYRDETKTLAHEGWKVRCRYLHSVRKTLPPPLARPWSDVHWPVARSAEKVHQPRRQQRTTSQSLLIVVLFVVFFCRGREYDCSCRTPTRMMEDWTDEIDESHAIRPRF